MNTLHFKYLLEVQRVCSISKAADNLLIAQPNLSKVIREMESTLDYPIFERSSHGVVPTQKGMKFLEHARKILIEEEQMQSLSRSADPDRQRLSAVFPRSGLFVQSYTRFLSQIDLKQSVDISFCETNSIDAIHYVADRVFDFAVIRYFDSFEKYFLDYLDYNKLMHTTIWEFSPLLVMSRKHTLADKKEIHLSDLNDYLLVAYGDLLVPQFSPTVLKKTLIPFTNTKNRIVLHNRANRYHLISMLPTAFSWDSPIPQYILDKYQLIQRPFVAPKYNWDKDVLIRQKDYEFTEMDNQFIDQLYKSIRELQLK